MPEQDILKQLFDHFTPLLNFFGIIASGLFGYWAARIQAKKDLMISDRQQLSEDERQFRASLIEELGKHKEEIRQLKEEIERLREQNINLQYENKKLQLKIEELTREVQKSYLRGGNEDDKLESSI